MSEQLCSWGAGFSMQMEHGPNPNSPGTGTGTEREGERGGENDFNSAVTREMSNTGHMGFTAMGIMGEAGAGCSGEARPSLMASQRRDKM